MTNTDHQPKCGPLSARNRLEVAINGLRSVAGRLGNSLRRACDQALRFSPGPLGWRRRIWMDGFRKPWRLVLLGTLGLVAVALDAAPAAAAAPTATVSPTVTPALAQQGSWAAVAEGGDGAAWYLASYSSGFSSGWTSLGGRVLTTPAVADYVNNPYGAPAPIFAAIGTDHQVYLTTVPIAPAVTWTPVGGYCLSGPAATITSSASGGADQLTVACEGGDGAMWVENVLIEPVGPHGTPFPVRILQGWTSYGGTLGAGPAIANVGDTGAVFFAETPRQQVFYETQPNSWTATPFYCKGHLAGGTTVENLIALGCQGGDGQMWIGFTSSPNALTGLTASPQGGALIGGPGLAPVVNGPGLMFAEGTDHAAYDKVPGTTTWSYLGGYLLGDGINATSL